MRAALAAAEQALHAAREAMAAGEARERQLSHELQHRVRNTLSVIRSIFRRSRESGASQDEFAEHFEGRLNAVARNQAAMVLWPGGEIEVEDVVRNELLVVHAVDGPDLVVEGPSIMLHGQAAEMIGLAVHELATNAVKFGALYHRGQIAITWSRVESPVPAVLRLHWREMGVPLLATAPRVRGFGQQLIEDALPYQLGATTSFEFKPGGVDCLIVLPLAAAESPRAVPPSFPEHHP